MVGNFDFYELFDKCAILYVIISFMYNANLSLLYYLFDLFDQEN